VEDAASQGAPAGDDSQEDYDMKYPHEYHNKEGSNIKVVEQVISNDGKIQRVYENGKKEVIFNNGVKREAFPDGYTIVFFNNNDIK
jgi:centromere protein J